MTLTITKRKNKNPLVQPLVQDAMQIFVGLPKSNQFVFPGIAKVDQRSMLTTRGSAFASVPV